MLVSGDESVQFADRLVELLAARFKGHWYPEMPHKVVIAICVMLALQLIKSIFV